MTPLTTPTTPTRVYFEYTFEANGNIPKKCSVVQVLMRSLLLVQFYAWCPYFQLPSTSSHGHLSSRRVVFSKGTF